MNESVVPGVACCVEVPVVRLRGALRRSRLAENGKQKRSRQPYVVKRRCILAVVWFPFGSIMHLFEAHHAHQFAAIYTACNARCEISPMSPPSRKLADLHGSDMLLATSKPYQAGSTRTEGVR